MGNKPVQINRQNQLQLLQLWTKVLFFAQHFSFIKTFKKTDKKAKTSITWLREIKGNKKQQTNHMTKLHNIM